MLILVVDDEESLCELVADVLHESYEVLKAFNGKEAWKKARQHLPDLIITDVMMPEMSGLDLLRKLKEDPTTAHIPVLLLSAVSIPETEGLEASFLLKPFEIDELEREVEEIIGGSKDKESGSEKPAKPPPKEAGPSLNFPANDPELKTQPSYISGPGSTPRYHLFE